MRPGPEYIMNIRRDNFNLPDSVTIPLELVSDFEEADHVSWYDNHDGSYTLWVSPRDH